MRMEFGFFPKEIWFLHQINEGNFLTSIDQDDQNEKLPVKKSDHLTVKALNKSKKRETHKWYIKTECLNKSLQSSFWFI